jgi:hypothetical protein
MRKALLVIVMVAVAFLPISAAPAATCGPPSIGWEKSRGDLLRPVNVLILYDKPPPIPASLNKPIVPTWNGSPVTPDQVREYLHVTTMMVPRPVFLLVISPSADCREVQLFRRIASEVLNCGPGECVEVSL